MSRVSFLPADHAPGPPGFGYPVGRFIEELAQRLGQPWGVLTDSGRSAMSAVFSHLGLRREDEVFVATTFDLPNVSSCVTCTIFNFCKPSRVLSAHTRAVFVIHEFGVPHPAMAKLRAEADSRKIPLIEDCAHTLTSKANDGRGVGQAGDWVIVSFPKVFPTRAGGLLAGRPIPYRPVSAEAKEVGESARLAAAWWPAHDQNARRRRDVYSRLSERCSSLGLSPLFEAREGITPWFFPVRVPDTAAVRRVAEGQEVDCNIWHGSDIVVFPCHEFLNEDDIERIIKVLATPAPTG